MKKLLLFAAAVASTLVPLSANAQLYSGGLVGGGPRYQTSQDRFTICIRSLGAFYKDLGTLYAIPINDKEQYMGTQWEFDRWNAISYNGELKRNYEEARSVCKGYEAYFPKEMVDVYVKGFNFRTGERL